MNFGVMILKNACLITIGSEIVEGIISDENSVYLSRKLLELGYRVKRIVSTDDSPDEVSREVRKSLEECDLVITTGGLGPTRDDITREAVAEAVGEDLMFNEKLFKGIADKVRRFAGKVVNSVRKEAMVIRGATVVENDVGSAPGQIFQSEGKVVLLLPGPPVEMRNVFEKAAKLLTADERYVVKTLKFYGVRESTLEDELSEILYSSKKVKVATQASYTMGVWIRFTAPKSASDELFDMVKRVKEIRGEDVYAEDNETMEERVVRLLRKQEVTMSVAESCSGGLLASSLVNIPGVSKVFKGGIIAYSDFVKETVLGVRPETLRDHGAVSEECVVEMSEGVANLLKSDYSVSISGVAGPEEVAGKPVGRVYIDIYDGKHHVIKRDYMGDRNTIRTKAVMDSLDTIRRMLGG